MEELKYNLEDLHAVQLRMLDRLTDICEQHQLRYFLAFGSLLGAARNHKIIAWDDSIDVVMPGPDYERLTALPRETWGGDLFLQTCDTDPRYPRCYAKLRDSGTTLIKSDFADCDINQGIYINIMPLINLADDAEERRRQIRDAKLYKTVTEGRPVPNSEVSLKLHAAFLLAASAQKKAAMREELKEKLLRYRDQDTEYCFALAGNVSLELPLPRAWFRSSVDWEFEGRTVKIPAGWHEWLTLRYGDYTVVPIADVRENKIADFVTLNTERPYTEYKGKTYCVHSGRAGGRNDE